jgi:hypothetical protein
MSATTNKRNKLQGLKLEVKSISRKGIEGAEIAYCCENCGKTIVNYATVTDGQKSYTIGLDCKKTLIDKDILDKLKSEDFSEVYEAKQYRKDLNDISKFLLESSRDTAKVVLSIVGNYIDVMVYDTSKKNIWGFDECVYSQNFYFLKKHGLEDYINKIAVKQFN